MTISESYPIHRCIFRNDSVALKKLLNDEKMQQIINEKDNHGNSPIHLALMLHRNNCINILLQYNCDVFSRNSFGWNPMEEASMIGDIDIIKNMAYKKWNEYVNLFVKEGGLLEEWNSTTPNLYIKCKLKLRTTIPLLQKFGAKDIQQLYKKGNNIRLDTTLAGVDTRGIPKLIKGNISVLLKYDEVSKKCTIYLIDHKKKIYQEFFPNIPELYLLNSLKSKVGANILYKFYYDLTKFNIKLIKGNMLKKTTKTFTLEDGKSYKCRHYRGKNFSVITKRRNDEALVGECESIINKDFKEKEASKAKKSKDGKLGRESSFNNNNNTSKASNDSDDESDSDSAYDDSDDNSDNESNVGSSKNDKPLPEFLSDLYSNTNENGKHPETTVTYTINKDGKTETFEKTTTMEDTLDWEQAYREKYVQNSDIIFNFINGKKDNTKIKRLNYMEIEKLDLKKMTEDEYFDPSSTREIHMGRIMNMSEIKTVYKHKIKFWMAKENTNFPISAYDIKPIFEFVMMYILDQINSNNTTNEYDKHAYEYITQTLVNRVQDKHTFPIKISVPVYPSVAFQTTFLNASKDTKYLPDELFEIPDDYNVGNVFFEYIHK